MEQGRQGDVHKLLRWSALLIAAHFAVVLWHLTLLVQVQPDFPGTAVAALILINLVPVAGLLAFAKGWPKLAGILIVIPLGTAFVIGTYTHFVASGADNVLQLPASGLALRFQISAVLLSALEALACGAGIGMLLLRRPATQAVAGNRRSA